MNYTSYLLNYEAPLVEVMSAAIAQGNIDVPDTMPAVENIIYAHAKINDIVALCTDGGIEITSNVNFIALYSDKDGITHSLEAKTGFSHEMSYPNIDEHMWADLRGLCQQVECKVITSSSISVKCVVEINGWTYKEHSIEIADALDGDISKVEVKTQKINWSASIVKAYGNSTIREDIRVDTQTNQEIDSIIDKSAVFIINKVLVIPGSVTIEGNAVLDILYKHDKGLSKTTRNLLGQITIENPSIVDTCSICPEVFVKNIDLRVYEDESERKSIISVEIPIYAKVYQQISESKEVVVDAFGIDAPLSLEYMDVELPKTPRYINKGNISFTDSLNLDGDFDAKDAMCIGEVSVDSVVGHNDEIIISGMVSCRMWNLDGTVCVNANAPYTLSVQASDIKEGSSIECDALLNNIDVFINNDNVWNVRGGIDLSIKVLARERVGLVRSIETGEEYTKDKYPLILAMTSKEDTIWSLAKRCRVSIDSLLALNPDLDKEIVSGKSVIVYRN